MENKKKHSVEKGTNPAPETIYIKVLKNGPYEVHGDVTLNKQTIITNAKGNSWAFEKGRTFKMVEPTHLCRCGFSKNKPYCDGSHTTAPVDMQETASFDPPLNDAEKILGSVLTLTDNEMYCSYARFCDNGQRVWNEVQLSGKEHEELTKRMVHLCPNGRLLAWDNTTQEPVENALIPELGLIEDSGLNQSAGLMVWGGIRVESASGESYQIRNRQTLCRCGYSSNKPFCDGTHASSKFKDGLDK